jgi:Tfp pilus assembly protein PilN
MYKINLLPQDLQPPPVIDKNRLVRMLSLSLLVCIVAGAYIYLVIDYQLKQEVLAALRQEVSTGVLTANKVAEIKKERQQNEEVINELQQLISNNTNWYALLNDVNYCLPDDTWLTGVTKKDEDKKTVLVFMGNSVNLSSIGFFIYNLQQLPYFSGVSLNYAKEQEIESNSALLTFKISADFPEGEKIE